MVVEEMELSRLRTEGKVPAAPCHHLGYRLTGPAPGPLWKRLEEEEEAGSPPKRLLVEPQGQWWLGPASEAQMAPPDVERMRQGQCTI